jgi:uncharacterized membrane protein
MTAQLDETVGSQMSSLERRLAALLQYGTWAASLMIAAGCVLALVSNGVPVAGADWVAAVANGYGGYGARIVTAGIALFILLPVLRLILMLGVFLHQRDYRFSVVTLLVLLIVFAGCVIGAHMSGALAA